MAQENENLPYSGQVDRRRKAISEAMADQFGRELTYDEARILQNIIDSEEAGKVIEEGLPEGYTDPFSDEGIVTRMRKGQTFSGTK